MNLLMIKQLDRQDIRLAVNQEKKPLFINWTDPKYKEKKNIDQLLAEYGCYGLRTGKQVGNYYFCVLDFDYNQFFLEFIARFKISWVKTARGAHIYLLIKKLPANGRVFSQEEKVGDFLSDGRQVIGINSLHANGSRYVFNKNGKYFWKVFDLADLKKILSRYGLTIK